MNEFLTTSELADLLRIKERKVYDMVANDEVPCTRVTGKLLFPRGEIDAWMRDGQSGPTDNGPLPNIIAGSHDPLLEWALRESGSGLAAFFDGSHDGMTRVQSRQAMGCGIHIHEPDGWNTDTITNQFATYPVIAMRFAHRNRGLIIKRGNPDNIKALPDLANKRFAKRQDSAASQTLFEQLADSAGLKHSTLAGPELPARTEDDVARLVLDDKADAAFGLESVAKQFQLDFLPIITERYDLLIWRKAWFDPPMQAFREFLQGTTFQTRAAEMGGYSIENIGEINFNGST